MASDPFGIDPPAWLTHLAKPADTSVMAKDIGMVFGGAMLGMQPDPDADPNDDGSQPLKGFKKGLTEARMNQQDPQWKVKEAALTAQAAGNWARAKTSWQDYTNRAEDDALWSQKDLPALTQWREELKKDPEAVAPIMESTKGHAAVQQVETGMLKNEAMRLRQENSRIQVDNQRRSTDWNNAMAAAPADVQAAIAERPNQGWVVDGQGRKLSPSTEALSIYNQWATDGNKNPDRAFGYKSNPVTAAKTRASPSGKSEPEFFTDPQTNRRFMRWGNKHYDLSGVTPQQRAEIEVAKADYNRAQKEYDKIVSTPEPSDAKSYKKYLEQKESLMQNIFSTRDNLSKLTKGAPSSNAPAASSTPKIFTDKSGKKFNYKGNASDPSTDKNPANWEVIP